MRLALQMTVRDERDQLRTNLLYHRFMGVESVYVYDDGSTDGTQDSVSDLPFVSVRPSIALDEAPDWPQLDRARASRDLNFVGRQVLNTSHAMERARADGFDWLVHLDADELAVVDRKVAREGALRDALDALPKSIATALFWPLEVVQKTTASVNPMVDETLFKRADRHAERTTYDPFKEREERIRTVYGHLRGKSAIRLSVAAYPRTPHRFVGMDGKKLPQRDGGDLLHFYAPDFESFARKFRTMSGHLDKHLQGQQVVLQKLLWRDVVNKTNWDDAKLRDYYNHWVAFSDEDIKRMSRPRGILRRKPQIVEVTSAGQAIRTLLAADQAHVDSPND